LNKQKSTQTGVSDDAKAKSTAKKNSPQAQKPKSYISPFLTKREAEVMFTVKETSGIQIKDIPEALKHCFAKHRSRSTVSEILNGIKRKEDQYNREYFEPAHSYPQTFSISAEQYVDKRKTGVMLLELRAGNNLGLSDEIGLEAFKQYLRLTLGDDLTALDERLKKSEAAGLIEIVEREKGEGGSFKEIRETPRLRHDLEYFILLAVDYLRELRIISQNLEEDRNQILQQLAIRQREKQQLDLQQRKKLNEEEGERISNLIDHMVNLLRNVKPGGIGKITLKSENLEVN
jgi:hypothetical protein